MQKSRTDHFIFKQKLKLKFAYKETSDLDENTLKRSINKQWVKLFKKYCQKHSVSTLKNLKKNVMQMQ